MKIQTIMLTHTIDKDGKRHYRVETVMNSAAYYPQQMLEVEEVAKLCADMAWQVSVVSTEGPSVVPTHSHA